MVGFLFGGDTGETAQSLARKRDIQDMLARQIMGQQPKTAAEGIGALLSGIGVGIGRYRTDKAQKAGSDAASTLYNSILGTPTRSTASAPSVKPGAMGGNMPKVDSKGSMPVATVGNDEIRSGIISSANALGIDPVDLATAISYETAGTFDPLKRGPTTQHGQHRGLIQFGETQAVENGVDWNNPVGSQLGENGAVVSYLRNAGVKPGMGMLDIYSAINAGGVGRYGASDANNGGAPGTVADKVNNQMAGHRQKALALLGQGGGATVGEPMAYYDDKGLSVETRKPTFSPDARSAGGARSTVEANAPRNAAEAVTAMAGGNMPAANPFVSPFVDPAMQSAAAANQAGASLSDEVAAFEQTPEYAARFPGRQVSASFPGKEADDMGVAALPQPVNVGANPVPPNSQPIDNMQIPPQFAGSQQLASAQGGIMDALNAGAPATPQQIAQAQAAGQQPTQVAQSGNGVDPRLYELLTNDFATPEMKAVARSMIEQQMLANDPMRQLEMRKLQRDLDAPHKRETSVVNGRLVDNQTGQVIAEYPDAQKPTADRQNYEYYRDFEVKNGRTPLGPLEWEQAQRKAGAGTTNVTVGESDKFYENLDKKNAETFAALSETGMQARARIGQINRLEGLFANMPQGIEGGFKKLAGDWGVAIGEGTSDIQAASALLEKMVPEQRAPGSGPMSDADIRMFRASLPRVLNQPGGNELIFQTMRGIAEYEQQMGAIADAVADREIEPAEGRKRIRELNNPLENYKIPDGPTPNEGTKKTRTGVNWGYEE
ncbi:hypothetical protein ASD01_29590 [Ensifer sp. Root423]|uniref:hypothetical protein n=1 Tax=Ensifer sp. Root423 TaxID=1736534 RepID=UPI000712466D|nr:hypothetical protein [Ensifer sp. Root423]KQX20971.1 hypothetical protein ASD01_29590 [Ensifer sp. Root423]